MLLNKSLGNSSCNFSLSPPVSILAQENSATNYPSVRHSVPSNIKFVWPYSQQVKIKCAKVAVRKITPFIMNINIPKCP